MIIRKKKEKLKKKQSWCYKREKNSARTIDVLMPPDTKKIIEEILDLILDENFNESASDELDNNSSTELKLNPSQEMYCYISLGKFNF